MSAASLGICALHSMRFLNKSVGSSLQQALNVDLRTK